MKTPIKVSLSIFVYFVAFSGTGYGGEIIYNEDRPYEVIDIAVPKAVWRQAFSPTPVLKSQATVEVPIHVSDEIEDQDEEEVEEIVTTPVNDASIAVQEVVEVASVANDQVQNVTEIPAEAEQVTPTQVAGQVTRFPCSCPSGQCGCCTGAMLDRINMKACGNISFIPEDFVFDVRLIVNNRTVVQRRVSASDPPPICFNPRRAPFVRVCAEISNIRIRNRNAFACLEITADIGGFPVYSVPFRCFGMGSEGVQSGIKPKPVSSSGPKPVNLFGSSDNDEPGFIENAVETVLDGGIGEAVVGGGGGGVGLFGGGGGLFGGGGGGGIFGGRRPGGIFGRKENNSY